MKISGKVSFRDWGVSYELARERKRLVTALKHAKRLSEAIDAIDSDLLVATDVVAQAVNEQLRRDGDGVLLYVETNPRGGTEVVVSLPFADDNGSVELRESLHVFLETCHDQGVTEMQCVRADIREYLVELDRHIAASLEEQ
jgi:hypothetical protein